MPKISYDTSADWQTWTWTNCEVATDGLVQLAAGALEGYGTSPVIYAVNWRHWGRLTLTGTVPQGCAVYLYVRSGQTEAECEAADWLGPFDVWRDGQAVLDLRTIYLSNPGAPVGPYLQLKIHLEAE
ncbi:MAG: hypothetical protein H5T86_12390 [Armatimonadetes bacterium]|nr:hypothetical protein [Armatimonadota bacterium]